jgi:hypothetical protein
MRSVIAVVAVVVLSTAASAAEPSFGHQAMPVGYGGYEGYCAPACASPCYGLVPGCCEFPPSCCDHVWDGYCQELRGLDALRAFCSRGGSRGFGCGGGCGVCAAACGPVAPGCCAIAGAEPLDAGAPGEQMVEIPAAPVRAE